MAALNLLLLGLSGNGKSSTGNSILGKREFTPRSATSGVVYDIRKATDNNKAVTVVDGPSIGNTVNGEFIELVNTALSLASYTVNAFLFVLKYGVRFTKQEKDAVDIVKTIFGEDVFKKYGIVVMTYGDSFDLDMEEDKLTFEAWCNQQTGDVQSLFIECGKRCVLFDNRTKEASKLDNQFKQLMRMVTEITSKWSPYTMENFKQAERGRRKLVLKSKLPELESKTDIFVNNISQQLDQIVKGKDQNHEENIEKLELLSDSVQNYIDFLTLEDQDTGSFNHLLTKVSIVKTRLRTMLDYQHLKVRFQEKQPEKPNFQIQLLFKSKKFWFLLGVSFVFGIYRYVYKQWPFLNL